MDTSREHSFIKSTSFGKRHLVLFVAIVIGITCSALASLPGWQAGAQTSINDQIAFDRGGNITLINSNGTGMVSHGPGFGPSFSPDATQIVFSFRNVDAVAISKMNADGTGRVQLTEMRQQSLAAWSPDGAKIAFSSEREDPEFLPGDDLYTTERIYLMDTNGANPKKLMTRAQSNTGTHIIKREFAPAWSPDGSQVAFIGFTNTASGSARENLYVVNRDGFGLREVTHFDGASLVTSKISWSPDGTKIAFGMNRDIYLVSIDGLSQPINLSNTTDREERDPAFSPGGGRIAYVVNHIDSLIDGLYIMKADGQNPTQILSSSVATDQQVNCPAWNPLAQDPPSEPPPPPPPSPEADMSIGMTAQPSAPKVGETVIYTLTVKNNGTANVNDSFAAFQRSANLDLVSVSPAQGACQTSASVPLGTDCNIGALASGASTTVNIAVRPTAVGTVGITGTVGASVPDPNAANNSVTLNVTAVAPPPCVPEVTGEVVQVISRPGSQTATFVTHTIYVQNTSGRSLNGLVHFVFEGLHTTISDVKTGSAFPRTRCAEPLGRPYKTVTVPNLVWQPTGIIRLDVNFFNPLRVPVNYNLRIYTGPNFP